MSSIAPFVSSDGKQNHQQNAFKTVFDVYEEIGQELHVPTRPIFSSEYFELLFPAAKAVVIKQQTRSKQQFLFRSIHNPKLNNYYSCYLQPFA